MSTERMPFNLADLHPAVRAQFLDLTALLIENWTDGKTEFLLRPFEGYRSPRRQAHLLATTKSTKAGPWQSSHQFGLAVDFVPDQNTKKGPFPAPADAKPHWYWPSATHPDWRVLGECAASVGLVQPIAWDKPHIESPLYAQIKRTIRSGL